MESSNQTSNGGPWQLNPNPLPSCRLLIPILLTRTLLGICIKRETGRYKSFLAGIKFLLHMQGNFCIIEGPETVQDFAKMELQEILDNIRSHQNKIFLHMEEVRRLRIQQRIKNAELGILKEEQEDELSNFPSFIPFLPPLSSANLRVYYAICVSIIAAVVIFGGLLAPTMELKLGLGGTYYADFIRNVHLPMQLSQVDPIVASFSGGTIGVISALMVVEINNVKQQEDKRCKYCLGTGYLACARCSSTGSLVLIESVATVNVGDKPLSPPRTERCSNCSGSGKVMCPTCLCTGMAMASEHDPRIDPFD
ncbi:protein ORANGE-ORANGE, chloroplastic-like isoform X2 [Macadamia integrifolia]|uniref:protein ORANGE-ORANGE, chloroplastic-like isoform X2 n=1 Tax=Macadamia integrifolia TaxID=60698 RepID=UPI001C4F4D11|nr:protein ORANGE-ORANGE, chloroplastic-like isoform X2 [Macadamia integrifolia]